MKTRYEWLKTDCKLLNWKQQYSIKCLAMETKRQSWIKKNHY